MSSHFRVQTLKSNITFFHLRILSNQPSTRFGFIVSQGLSTSPLIRDGLGKERPILSTSASASLLLSFLSKR